MRLQMSFLFSSNQTKQRTQNLNFSILENRHVNTRSTEPQNLRKKEIIV